MIAKKIADVFTMPKKCSFAQIETEDSERGFEAGFKAYREEWERHDFSIEREGITIYGEYIVNPKSGDGRKKVAVIAHGLTANRFSDLKYGMIFYKLGYNLVIFDERCHGKSDGIYCTLGQKESLDIKEICKFAKSIFGEDCFLALHGESMGAAAVLNLLEIEKPDLVVADCPFADLDLLIGDLAKSQLGFLAKPVLRGVKKICNKREGFDYTTVKPVRAVENSDVPILFFHGKSDSLINCKHSELLFSKSKNPLSRLYIVDGADHAFSIVTDKDSYEKRVIEFVTAVEAEKL